MGLFDFLKSSGKLNKSSCSICKKGLEYLGKPNSGFSPTTIVMGSPNTMNAMEQWSGSLCADCQLVFCKKCLVKFPPLKCPKCGKDLKPVFKSYLDQISPKKVNVLETQTIQAEGEAFDGVLEKIESIVTEKRKNAAAEHFFVVGFHPVPTPPSPTLTGSIIIKKCEITREL